MKAQDIPEAMKLIKAIKQNEELITAINTNKKVTVSTPNEMCDGTYFDDDANAIAYALVVINEKLVKNLEFLGVHL